MMPHEALTAHLFWKNNFPDYSQLKLKFKEKGPSYFRNLFHNLEPDTLDMIEEKDCSTDVVIAARFLFRYMDDMINITTSITRRGRIDKLTLENIRFLEEYLNQGMGKLPLTLAELSEKHPGKDLGKCSEKLSKMVVRYEDFENNGHEDMNEVEDAFAEFVAEAENAALIDNKQKDGLLHLNAALQPLITHKLDKKLAYPLVAAPVLLSYTIMLPIENSVELINIITASLSTYVSCLV
jgi:hypothetical protein